MTVDRKTLYEEVWQEPMTTVADRYGVSSSFLARVCERLNVPRPSPGHWSKLRHGKSIVQLPLPQLRPGDEQAWSPGTELLKLTTRKTSKIERQPIPQTKRGKRRRHKKDRPTQHELLKGALAHFEKVRVSVLDEGEELHLKPTKQLLLDVCASKPSLDEALGLANELYLTLEDRGFQTVLAPSNLRLSGARLDVRADGGREEGRPVVWRPLRPTVVFIGTLAIGLSVYEMTEEIELRWVDGKYIRADAPIPKRTRGLRTWTTRKNTPSGRLAVLAYSPYYGVNWTKRWSEKRSGELRSKCSTIARELIQTAPAIVELVKEANREEEVRQKQRELERVEWKRREAERQRLLTCKASKEELLDIVEQWTTACRIEAFFADVASSADDLDEDDQANILSRLDEARALFGDPEALSWFRDWKLASER